MIDGVNYLAYASKCTKYIVDHYKKVIGYIILKP